MATDFEGTNFGGDTATAGGSLSGGGGGNDNNDRQAYTSPTTGQVGTQNFNIDRSQSSRETSTGRVYGTQSELDTMFGPSPTDDTIGGMGFSFGGGRQSMAQMTGFAGQYSPTIAGSAYSGFSGGTGISAPDFGTATGSGGLGFADQIMAINGLTSGGASVGKGLSSAPVYRNGKLTTPGVVGLAKNQQAMRTNDLAQQMAVATGRSYAGRVTPTATTADTNFLTGVDVDKGGYAVYGKGSQFDVGRITDERVVEEAAVGAILGPLGSLAFGSPDLAEVTSLSTGEVGSYTDIGGLVGMMTGPSVSFDNTPLETGGDDSDPYIPYPTTVPTPMPANIRRRFRTTRSALAQGPSVSRFPRAPQAQYARPSMYAAEGGVVQDFDYVKDGLEQKKRGYHAYAIGGRVYAVAPDRANPMQYKAYGGTIDQVKNAIGGAFGYDPQTLDLNKFPGEPGFGQDLQNFIPGVGGMTANQQFITANGNTRVNTSDPFVQKYANKMRMAQGGAVGFIGARPEQVEEKDTVADGVPMNVPEGTFVINAPAVEFAGSKDVEAMIDGATKRANELGIDIEKEIAKIASKGLVPLAVSPGEVLVDPVRAKIIGYDRLEKINNRGKEEVARRTKENPPEENPESPIDQQMVALGGRISKNRGGTAQRILNEEMPYALREGPASRAEVIQKAKEQDPVGFISIQEANTQDKTDYLDMAQFYTDDIVAKSPESLRKLDKMLLENSAYSLGVLYGSEDDRGMTGGIRGVGPVERLRGLKEGTKAGGDSKISLPGKDKDPDLLLHESAHVQQPLDSRSFFARSYGLLFPEEGKAQEEAAVTTLDLYRNLYAGDTKGTLEAIDYLFKQYNQEGLRKEDVPNFRTEEGLQSLLDNAVQYVYEISDNQNLYSDEEKMSVRNEMSTVFGKNADKLKEMIADVYQARQSRNNTALRQKYGVND